MVGNNFKREFKGTPMVFESNKTMSKYEKYIFSNQPHIWDWNFEFSDVINEDDKKQCHICDSNYTLAFERIDEVSTQ